MATADRGKIRLQWLPSSRAAGQLFATGLLLCFAFLLPLSGQSKLASKEIERARMELDNGNYSEAIRVARTVSEGPGQGDLRLSALDVVLISQIALQDYAEAATTLDASFRQLDSKPFGRRQVALVHLSAADLFRAERKFPDAVKHTRIALETAPDDAEIQAGYYLSLGRIMFRAGYDLSAIVWLEKAEQAFESTPVSSAHLDVYRFLSLAWSSKLNYPAALRYSEKFVSAAAGSRFKHKHRQALFEAGTLLSSIGQKQKASAARMSGLKLSLESKHDYQARNFLSSLLLTCLYDSETQQAATYLKQLESLDTNGDFSFEVTLGKAIILAISGEREPSERLFAALEKRKNNSPFIIPSWKITLAEKNKRWEEVIEHNRTLLDLTVAQNFREDLPRIYLTFATAHFSLGEADESIDYLNKALALIDEIRTAESKSLSLGLLETYHTAYRLLAQIKLNRPLEAFELSDYLKGRLLKDKVNNSPTTLKAAITPDVRQKLEIQSLRLFNDPGIEADIRRLESSFTTFIPERRESKTKLSELDRSPDLEGKAIVSYLFTLDNRLLAFVWEKGKPSRSIYLPGIENEIAIDVKKTEQKIKNRIFFKRDGKDLFDKLLKPLNISAPHLIIVPDKQLWKIPFQALSPDGEKYLIEDKLVSYAPSVSILLEQLKSQKPTRRTLQAFANSSYDNQFLRHVNEEATGIAGIFGSRPALNATISDFRRLSDKTDILHFSMHARVDNDEPLDSYLGLKAVGNNHGRLTVENLLDTKLRKGSLVFLASCETNNVLSGEGLVSLAWGMMGAGATTVISAQWEADDKLTGVFTKAFYTHYKQGISSAEALQRASLEMIRNKSNNTHEPYYWADFTLSGDFR